MDLKFDLLTRQHVEWARKLHNDESTLLQLTDVEHVSELQQERWFESISTSKTSRRYIVFADQSGECVPCGLFRVDAIDLKNRSVMVGLDIDPRFRGLGLAKPIYEHFLEYYFKHVGMHRVYLKVLETNVVARHLYERLGFVEEGRDRAAIFRSGKYADYICMSMLENEYASR